MINLQSLNIKPLFTSHSQVINIAHLSTTFKPIHFNFPKSYNNVRDYETKLHLILQKGIEIGFWWLFSQGFHHFQYHLWIKIQLGSFECYHATTFLLNQLDTRLERKLVKTFLHFYFSFSAFPCEWLWFDSDHPQVESKTELSIQLPLIWFGCNRQWEVARLKEGKRKI